MIGWSIKPTKKPGRTIKNNKKKTKNNEKIKISEKKVHLGTVPKCLSRKAMKIFMKPIGYIHSPYMEKTDAPWKRKKSPNSQRVDMLDGTSVFYIKPYDKELCSLSDIWYIWGQSPNAYKINL